MIGRGFLNPVIPAANFRRAKIFNHSGSGFCAIGAETHAKIRTASFISTEDVVSTDERIRIIDS
jgi:hypothetical protein